MQAVDLSPADVAAALEALLAERTRFPRELCAWQRHISEAAESAVAAAESSIGMEGLHEAALASAQAVVAAVEGFTPQVRNMKVFHWSSSRILLMRFFIFVVSCLR